MTQQQGSSKKAASYLFVGGDPNGRLTEEANHVCSLVGIDAQELQIKTLDYFINTTANEKEASAQHKLYEKNRQAKIDVIIRNLAQLRNTQSPGRKMAMTFTSLSMAPEERAMHSAGQRRLHNSSGKLDPRLWQQSPPQPTVSKRDEFYKLDTQDKTRQKWLAVLQKKEQIFDEHTQAIKDRFAKRFQHENAFVTFSKERKEIENYNAEQKKIKHDNSIVKKTTQEDAFVAKLRKEGKQSMAKIQEHNQKRAQRLEDVQKETATKTKQFWPESPDRNLDNTISKSMNSTFGAGFDAREKRSKMQSILEYTQATGHLGEKVENIELARDKRKNVLDYNLKFVRNDYQRVQQLYESKYENMANDYDDKFRRETEKRAEVAKRNKKATILAQEVLEFNLGEKNVKKDEQVNRFKDKEDKRRQASKVLTAKHNHKRDEKIAEMRQAEVDAMHEQKEDRHVIQNVNMQRRKRMQSEYRSGLVEQMLDKKFRAMSMEKVRSDIVQMGANKQKNTASQMYSTFGAGAQTIQPLTVETYKKEFDFDRKKAKKTKAEGGAN